MTKDCVLYFYNRRATEQFSCYLNVIVVMRGIFEGCGFMGSCRIGRTHMKSRVCNKNRPSTIKPFSVEKQGQLTIMGKIVYLI